MANQFSDTENSKGPWAEVVAQAAYHERHGQIWARLRLAEEDGLQQWFGLNEADRQILLRGPGFHERRTRRYHIYHRTWDRVVKHAFRRRGWYVTQLQVGENTGLMEVTQHVKYHYSIDRSLPLPVPTHMLRALSIPPELDRGSCVELLKALAVMHHEEQDGDPDACATYQLRLIYPRCANPPSWDQEYNLEFKPEKAEEDSER